MYANGDVSFASNLIANGNLTVNNANLGNLAIANFITGTLTTNAQPNITSVGNLTSLDVTGNVSASNVTVNLELSGNTANFTGNVSASNVTVNLELSGNTANFTGNVSANNANITNIVNANNITVTNYANANNITASEWANANNITVTANISAGNVKTDNLLYANGTPWDLEQPGGSNTDIQFNDAGDLGGSNAFTFNNTTNVVSLTGNLNATYGNFSDLRINNTNIHLGDGAGTTQTANYNIAIGSNAGWSQSGNSIAIGGNAGYSQGAGTIAIGGANTGNAQNLDAIAIGYGAASNPNGSGTTQAQYGIAIGSEAALYGQGQNSIAIGRRAGHSTSNTAAQPSNQIIINGTGSNLWANTSNAFYVKPIRSNITSDLLYYDTTTSEISYGSLSTFLSGYQGNIQGNNITALTKFRSNTYQSLSNANSNISIFASNIQISVENAANALVIANNKSTLSKPIQLPNVTVANLPNANIGIGSKMFVTDSNSTTFYNIVGAGGTNIVPVFSDGTDWRIG
jgi:hypothetical protein